MSLGLLCIAADISRNQDLIIDNINGRLVPSEDPMALVSSVAFMLNNPEKFVLMGVNARKTIESEYSISIIADGYMKLYRGVSSAERG
jgi:glycosyltransferase involved in cell wall biosynthesis